MGSVTVLSMTVEVRAAGPCQPARTQNEDYVPLPCGWWDLIFCTAQQAICPCCRLYSLCELWWSVFAGLGESGGLGGALLVGTMLARSQRHAAASWGGRERPRREPGCQKGAGLSIPGTRVPPCDPEACAAESCCSGAPSNSSTMRVL